MLLAGIDVGILTSLVKYYVVQRAGSQDCKGKETNNKERYLQFITERVSTENVETRREDMSFHSTEKTQLSKNTAQGKDTL